ncbi:Crp-Fnr family transciptional regulator [Oceaniovalibus guishaninsula JLT2003]|uniref:Crp-Fnr family transciptional regulator n=1 Tax=Oceaniovalibus guishaninsula JLT2003 TaxID=1231392 RepID=K2HD99_9RHOB|nr:Crp/Fnr family transcriptional regulator [Oceaniovalibus guishaninsula]EKE44537.1 Crp-Fnr family transciptional regulator [Oceaniovalibus guishaninsula JLT2003]
MLMAVHCAECPLRRLPIFDPFSAEDVALMEELKIRETVVEPGATVLDQGSPAPYLFTVLSGMGLRHVRMADGKRQVINFLMPGDFIGLQGAVLEDMGHTIEATTRMVLCTFRRDRFFRIFAQNPQRAYDVVWLAASEEHFLGDALATIGQLPAIERVAWAIAQIHQRALALGLALGDTMPFPYRQQDLADLLGLSLVHTNKTLARLREMDIVVWRNDALHIRDPGQLHRLAGAEIEPARNRPLL